MRQLVPVALSALLTASCAGSPSPSAQASDPTPSETTTTASPSADVYLPTYPSMESLPSAQIGGRLVEDGGCLWMETPEYRALPLWPSGSRIERDGTALVVVNTAGARAEVGTEVIGGGGEYGSEHYDFVVELIGEEIPEACRGDGFYWLVYDVRAR